MYSDTPGGKLRWAESHTVAVAEDDMAADSHYSCDYEKIESVGAIEYPS